MRRRSVEIFSVYEVIAGRERRLMLVTPSYRSALALARDCAISPSVFKTYIVMNSKEEIVFSAYDQSR
jgi:hypothetical protein